MNLIVFKKILLIFIIYKLFNKNGYFKFNRDFEKTL